MLAGLAGVGVGAGTPAARQPRVPVRIWAVVFQFLVMPRQQGGRNIDNVSLYGCRQLPKENKGTENLIGFDNACKMIGSSLVYRCSYLSVTCNLQRLKLVQKQ